jgi:branched-chain amino acid transport system ATP-binding protein
MDTVRLKMILDIRNLTKHFGGLHAVSRLSFHVEQHEILGIIGPNGSGKTTLFNLITGYYRPDEGQIFFEEKDVTGHKPHDIVSKGIARTSQVTRIFSGQSALENVIIGMHCRTKTGIWGALTRGRRTRAEEEESREKAIQLLKYLFLEHVEDRQSDLLSSAEQRRLMIGIALASQPRLLLLDEPTAGMSFEETEQVVDIINDIRKKGTTIILIEHNMKVSMGICDRLLAIERGCRLAEGLPEMICSDPRVIEAYLGEDDACSE